MDLDTALLIAMTACALGWFFTIRIIEARKHVKQRQEQEIASMLRAERVKVLSGRM